MCLMVVRLVSDLIVMKLCDIRIVCMVLVWL